MFINAASTISFQHSFRNPGFSSTVRELSTSSELVVPDYNEFIPAMDRRRMSHVQKMSIACAMDCLQQAQIEQPDAIIIGTSMGCCVNIKNFLDKILSANEGPLSPTSFIVSTHNTIAGQIALVLKNHGYNMTYTQNSLSFEQGLIDTMLCCKEGLINVLVGGADEQEETIYNTHARLKNNKLVLTCGASYFILSDQAKSSNAIELVEVLSYGLVDDASKTTQSFLKSNNLSASEIDLVLYSFSEEEKVHQLEAMFGSGKLVNYQNITGTYYTSSAFAMHYAVDILSNASQETSGKKAKTILVYNNLIPENLGLILLKSNFL